MKKTIRSIAVMLIMLLLCSCGETGELPLRSQVLDKDGFVSGVKALDYVELCDLSKVQVTNDQIQELTDMLLDQYPVKTEVYDRPVADGETVNIDYTGYIDGVAFEGGSTDGQGYEIVVGETIFIDTFINDLKGHMPGDSFEIQETFPQYYPANESLQNKEATFKVTINYLVDKSRAELTDEYVNENLSADYGWTTVAELKEGVLQQLAYDYVHDNSTIKEVPQSVTTHLENQMRATYESYAEYYHMTAEEFVSAYFGVESMDEVIFANADYIATQAEQALLFQAIAEKENLTKITKEDIREYFKETTGMSDFSSFKSIYGMPYLKQMTRNHKIFALLTDRAAVQ